MTRRHGHCRRGARLVAKVPQSRWRTLTFLAALRRDRITAPCVIDGPINEHQLSRLNRAVSGAYPQPRRCRRHGQSRQSQGQGGAPPNPRRRRQAVLPARYSPDLNPIEQVFAKLKTLVRKTDPRSIEATWRTIGALLDHFTPEECAKYLANAGYASA
jgi:transposase